MLKPTKQIYMITLIFLSLLAPNASGNSELTKPNKEDKIVILASDPWCPYNCIDNKYSKGYVVELMQSIFNDQGYKLKYQNMIWSRALEHLKKGTVDVIFGIGYGGILDEQIFDDLKDVSYEDSYKFIFPKGLTTKLGYGNQVNFALTDRKVTWNPSLSFEENMKNEKLGIQYDYDYGKVFTDFKKRYPNQVFTIKGDNPLPRLIKMAISGRVTVIPEDRNVFMYNIKLLGYEDRFKALSEYDNKFPQDSDLLALFTPAQEERSRKLNKILTQGLKTYRDNGKLAKILKKYGVKDWMNDSK